MQRSRFYAVDWCSGARYAEIGGVVQRLIHQKLTLRLCRDYAFMKLDRAAGGLEGVQGCFNRASRWESRVEAVVALWGCVVQGSTV